MNGRNVNTYFNICNWYPA